MSPNAREAVAMHGLRLKPFSDIVAGEPLLETISVWGRSTADVTEEVQKNAFSI